MASRKTLEANASRFKKRRNKKEKLGNNTKAPSTSANVLQIYFELNLRA